MTCVSRAAACDAFSAVTSTSKSSSSSLNPGPSLSSNLNPFSSPVQKQAKPFEISPADPVMNVQAIVLSELSLARDGSQVDHGAKPIQ